MGRLVAKPLQFGDSHYLFIFSSRAALTRPPKKSKWLENYVKLLLKISGNSQRVVTTLKIAKAANHKTE